MFCSVSFSLQPFRLFFFFDICVYFWNFLLNKRGRMKHNTRNQSENFKILGISCVLHELKGEAKRLRMKKKSRVEKLIIRTRYLNYGMAYLMSQAVQLTINDYVASKRFYELNVFSSHNKFVQLGIFHRDSCLEKEDCERRWWSKKNPTHMLLVLNPEENSSANFPKTRLPSR